MQYPLYKRREKQPLGYTGYESMHVHAGKLQTGPEHMLGSNDFTVREISYKTQKEEMRKK